MNELAVNLGKVLIAVAWVDGQMTHEELNSLKDMLFQMPEISGEDWRVLEMYMDHPIDDEERQLLIDQLIDRLRSKADQEFVFKALEDLANADQVLRPEEAAVIDQITDQMKEARSFVNTLRQLLRIRKEIAMDGTREAHFDDFVKNKVYYRVCQKGLTVMASNTVSEERIRMLCLAGAMMAMVAHEDKQLADEESTMMRQVLQRHWNLGAQDSAIMTEAALSEAAKGLSRASVTRQFYEQTSYEQRVRFLDVLFAIAAADGDVDHDEIGLIREIAAALKLNYRTFIDAKVKVVD